MCLLRWIFIRIITLFIGISFLALFLVLVPFVNLLVGFGHVSHRLRNIFWLDKSLTRGSSFMISLCDCHGSVVLSVEFSSPVISIPSSVWLGSVTHLFFLDHLMIFSVGNRNSSTFVQSVLSGFQELSGLVANDGKSLMVCASMFIGQAKRFLKFMVFLLVSLPIRYLGLPFISGRFSLPLLEKVSTRVRSWFVRTLSYAGRTQFIQSVLKSFQVCWANVFVLPNKVI